MKKLLSVLLAAVMMTSVVAVVTSCGNEETTGDTTTVSTTTGKATTTTSTTTVDPNPPITIVTPDIKNLATSTDNQWNYKVFYCQYSTSGPGGEFIADTDEMLSYFDNNGWTYGDATVPESVLADAATWPAEYGPFGDVAAPAENTDIGWEGDNHGLIIYTTFTIEDLESIKNDYEYVDIWAWYDNTCCIYINGQLVFSHIGDFTDTETGRDWVDGVTLLENLEVEDLKDVLVEGENNVLITMKDAWGGREIYFELLAES